MRLGNTNQHTLRRWLPAPYRRLCLADVCVSTMLRAAVFRAARTAGSVQYAAQSAKHGMILTSIAQNQPCVYIFFVSHKFYPGHAAFSVCALVNFAEI